MIRHQHFSSRAAVTALALSLVLGATSARGEPQAHKRFEVPAQRLADALKEVAALSGRNLIVPSDLVDKRRSPALSGRFTPEQAMKRLLADTGLVLEVEGDAFIVRAEGGESVQEQSDVPDDEAEDEIVVTGTNLRGVQPTSPLVRITREEIDRTGATSVEQLMRRVPQNTQGGVNQENSGIALPDQDVTDHGAGLNLRGLGQRATLILVNGRRLAPSGSGSFVDVSLIPLSAVERIEVLPDGASAIYGSDAVGGVVNFILRDGKGGSESALLAGTSTRSGGEQLQLSQSLGQGWESGNALLAYEFRLEEEVLAGQRPFTVNLRPGTFLLPRERKHSLFASLDQELGAAARAGLTGSFAQRRTNRTLFQSVSPLPVGVDAEAEAMSFAGEIEVELGGGWLARADANHARSDSQQRQTQPGGIELVNARFVQNRILEGSLRVDGAFLDLPAGPARLAVGGLVRRETYRDAFESSSIPEAVRSARRSVRSVFAELSVPIFSEVNRRPLFERLLLSAAARHDDYSRTGSTFDPKLGLLWSPTPGLDLRGSYSTSFRAPLLSEISGAYTAIYIPALFLYADPSQAPAGAVALFLQGSNPDLRPETSRTWSFGADFAPAFAPGLRLSINHYSIRFANRIALPTPVVNVIGNPAFESIIDRNPDAGRLADLVSGAQLVLDVTGPGFSNGGATPADVFIVLDDRVSNTAATTTKGADLAVRYAFDRRGSRITLDAAVTHIFTFRERLTPTSPDVQALDRPYRPLDWRARGGISWADGGWSGSLFGNYAGAYRDDRFPSLRKVDAFATIEASLAYTFGVRDPAWLRGARLSFFVDNLLDAAPPPLPPDPGTAAGPGYDPVNASGRGRFLALQLRRPW